MAKGFGGLPGNLQGMMEQAKKLQAQMMKAKEEAAQFSAEGSAGGGAVKVVANGKFEIVSVTISKDACSPEDVEMLQDLVKIATNDALSKVRQNTEQSIGKVTGGMSIPGLF